MTDKISKILTEKEILAKSRSLRPDEEKCLEFTNQNLEKVLQFLKDEKITDKFREYLEKNSSRLVSPHEDDLFFEEHYIRLVTQQGDFPSEEEREAFTEKWIRHFADDLCYLLFVILGDPDDRLNYSRSGLEYRRGMYETHLQIIEGLLGNPTLMEKLGYKREQLVHRGEELQIKLKKTKPPVKRAGQRKFLEFPLFPITGRLALLGYTKKNDRARFLLKLFRKYDVQWISDIDKVATDMIRQWESLEYLPSL